MAFTPAASPASAPDLPDQSIPPSPTSGKTRGAAARSPGSGLHCFGGQIVVEFRRDRDTACHVPLGARVVDLVELPLHVVHERSLLAV
jgi:hypothetical protein